jgi:2-polyprenyl-3-methyl-5-hydroxy-6-metoxy-1,4-benzoquinol methylase
MSSRLTPPPVPAVLRLAQSAVMERWRAAGEELYRELAHLLEAGRGRELLVAGCGDGVAAEWLAMRTGATVTGVDPDRATIARAEARARQGAGMPGVSYETAPLDDLPHETAVFDGVVGEPTLAAAADPARAVEELVRVTRPMGVIVLLQPTWSAEMLSEGADGRELVVERLGLRPYHLVEWKRMLREAGAVEIQVQDWSEGAPGCGRRSTTGMAAVDEPRLSFRHKVHIVSRAWKQWGWRAGALDAGRGAVDLERRILRALSRERSLGLHLITGVKWPHHRR